MTSPEDDDLEDELRRALSEAADGIEVGPEGLEKIRARIAGRPPQPWLVSVFFGVVERVRNWTWRGHWAWPERLSRLTEVRWPRSRRGSFPGWGTGSLRLATVLAAIAVIATVTLGVQPFRNAIRQASGVLQGDSGSPRSTVGTEANGAPTVVPGNGTSLPASGQAGRGGTAPARTPGTGKTRSSAAPCASSTASPQASLTNVRTSTSAPAVTTPAVSATAVSATATPAKPGAASSSLVACPVSPTNSATPTPTASGDDSGTVTAPVTAPVTGTPASSPSSGPSWWSGQGHQHNPWPPHRHRHRHRH